ncbi:ribosome small subunit-dependent GTPase A [Candidatus Leptofilum sp.]|uniref:ribosome small subunit-dependent GTPase A n=1 Tax=Candidatus Leptofilum sp. TaxID=3241576 RepID=UPI003B59431C
MAEKLEGRVIKAISGFYTVEIDGHEPVVAQIAGRLKQEWQSSTLVAAGDWVTISLNPDGTGTVEAVAKRKSVLSRSRPTAAPTRKMSADQEQVLVANLDQVIFVFAVKNPTSNLRKLDRFLVVAEMNNLPTIICLNKIDLDKKGKVAAQFQRYADIGYPVLHSSVKTGEGIAELKELLHDKISVLAGSSGVGKSSLLNAVQPGLGLKVSAVSGATGKGMHTTRFAELFPLDDGGYVADTPGIRGLALFDLEPTELDAYFREIAPLVSDCQFSDCSHRHEPGCEVLAAVADGRIHPNRYNSYLRLRDEHEALDEENY